MKYREKKLLIIAMLICIPLFILYKGGFFLEKNTNITNEDKKKTVKIKKIKLINGIDIKGLKEKEAITKLKEKDKSIYKKINIIVNKKRYEVDYVDLGVKYNYLEAYNKIKNIKENISIEAEYMIDEKTMDRFIDFIYDDSKINGTIPLVRRINNKFVGSDGRNAYILKKEEAKIEIIQSILNNKTTVLLEAEEIENKYTIEKLNENLVLLGTATTSFSGSGESRVQNIKVASDSINGKLILPNSEFSTGSTFAPYTKEKGYEEATVLVNNKLATDMGGGVCQVSSTLYNTLLNSEIMVTEKHNHSIKVSYVDFGFDSVLSLNNKDLKFLNDTGYPIYVESIVNDNNITINIYGKKNREEGYRVEYENELVTIIQPKPIKIIIDPEQYIGYEKEEVKALSGYTYKLYKNVYQDDELIEKKLIDTSYYMSRQGEKIVGGKKLEEEENNDTKKETKTQDR